MQRSEILSQCSSYLHHSPFKLPKDALPHNHPVPLVFLHLPLPYSHSLPLTSRSYQSAGICLHLLLFFISFLYHIPIPPLLIFDPSDTHSTESQTRKRRRGLDWRIVARTWIEVDGGTTVKESTVDLVPLPEGESRMGNTSMVTSPIEKVSFLVWYIASFEKRKRTGSTQDV